MIHFLLFAKEFIFAYHTVAYVKFDIVNPFQKSATEGKASDSSKPQKVPP